MIGKVLRGTRVQGLVRYLFGPGRGEEHRNPHIVAGFRVPAELEPELLADGSRDFRRLDGLLTQPLALLGDRNYRKPVWHLPVRAAPEDPILTDGQWARIAEEIMDRVGLAPAGDDEAVRWVAVRHAEDHIHIVATLARCDGVRPEVWNDGYRVRDACRAVEDRFGLRSTAPADRTAARRPHRGETEKTARHGWAEPPRIALRRHVTTAAAGARDEAEFFAHLDKDKVLVRKRFSDRSPGEVTGYAVALPEDRTRTGGPVWFGGGKLAADLTLLQLRCRWATFDPGGDPLSGDYHPVSGRHLSAPTARAVLRTSVREAADRSRTAGELFRELTRAGVLVRPRFSEHIPGQVTGYAVTLPDHTGRDGRPVWFGGGRLAEDLTWPRLHQRWNPTTENTRRYEKARLNLTPLERQAFYDDAARATAYATAQVRRHAALAPHAARDACWAASDTLHVAAKALGNRHLQRAADAYDRAARAPYGQIPRRSLAGDGLRTAARLLAMADLIGDRTTVATLVLVTNLIALMQTIAQLHQAQQRTAQATAAQTAGNHLRRAGQPTENVIPWLSDARRTPLAFDLAMADFPQPWSQTVQFGLPDDAAEPRPTNPERSVGSRRPARPVRGA